MTPVVDSQLLQAAALSLVTLALTTALHYEGLKIIGRPWSTGVRAHPVIAITALVALHLAEIGVYAFAYYWGTEILALGGLRGIHNASGITYFYFSAETYSTLGYGDLVPTGALRLLASAEPLNGLLLLAWSGAFLFQMANPVASQEKGLKDSGAPAEAPERQA